ncbi:MAG: hypothetical protein WC450_08875 [Candidatus Omnitrophota bacterium]
MANGNQVILDFSRPKLPIDDEKKTALIAFRVGEQFKHNLEQIAKAKGRDISKVCQEYVIQGFLEDYKNVLLNQLNSKATLSDLLR